MHSKLGRQVFMKPGHTKRPDLGARGQAKSGQAAPHGNAHLDMPLKRRISGEHSKRRTKRSAESVLIKDDFPSSWIERNVWLACLCFRLINALLVRTYFNPDEHWQSLEVAHHAVFGYGHLTWEWTEGVRSYVHPLIFASLYKLLALFGWDTPSAMVRAPRILQAGFASVGDLYLYKLSQRIFNKKVARYALFCHIINWFTFFCLVRTLSSSLETVLTIMALFYWPLGNGYSEVLKPWPLSSRQIALLIAGITCAIRPTNAIIWMYLGPLHLFMCKDKLKFAIVEVVPIMLATLGFTCLVDRWMYGKWVFVFVKFIQFNVLSGGASFYGSHPWHWYFSQGFPTMTFTLLPFSIMGIWWSQEKILSSLIAWVLGAYSLLQHKEFRFVFPVLPLSMMFAGYSLSVLAENHKMFSSKRQVSRTIQRILMFLLVTNVPAALYTSLLHQRGSEAVVQYLGKEASRGKVKSILFLMQCHGTPFYSSIHQDLPMKFLDCSPSDEDGYITEADKFAANPLEMLNNIYNMSENHMDLPSHVVLFDSWEPAIKSFLNEHSYFLEKKFFHAHLPVDRELQANVLVYCLPDLRD